MDAAGDVALFVGLSTAVVALIGYWNTQHLQRRDRTHRRQHKSWTSLSVGRAHGTLLATTRRQLSNYRDQAWAVPVMSPDEEVLRSPLQYPYDNGPQWELCILAMRRELVLFSGLSRRDKIRRCAALSQSRAALEQRTLGS
jgi:hypothetical protein